MAFCSARVGSDFPRCSADVTLYDAKCATLTIDKKEVGYFVHRYHEVAEIGFSDTATHTNIIWKYNNVLVLTIWPVESKLKRYFTSITTAILLNYRT